MYNDGQHTKNITYTKKSNRETSWDETQIKPFLTTNSNTILKVSHLSHLDVLFKK